ncbi:Ldh family oxidoreductase [Acetobacteraceae bacterium H6797]|nr:Ldh family oxidoreductase [Acetobacteraceae bacterium H6797]
MSLEEAGALAEAALRRAGADAAMARLSAEALVAAEAAGLASHGLSRVPQYCDFLRLGRAEGAAEPRILARHGATALIDAGNGLAFPALDLARRLAAELAAAQGVAFVGVTRSHHGGALGLAVEALAEEGLVAIAFSNSPAAMAVPGGRRALMGTNPVAAAFPRAVDPPLVIDLALSAVARGKIMNAAKAGEPIPLGWATDAAGEPTTDAKAALAGNMAPLGGDKGALLALVVELLCCALTGAAFGFEADSFFTQHGNQPSLGQALLVIDPGRLAGREAFLERVETMVEAMLSEPGVRLPGSRRRDLRARAERDGLVIPPALLRQIEELAA